MTDSIDIASAAAPSPSFDRADLEVALRVLGAAHELPEDHPDRIALRDATSGMYKSARKKRRRDFRDAVSSADREVVARTATGAPDRIDDETRGIELTTSVESASAGSLLRPRNCYVCKELYIWVDAFYH